LLGIPTKKGSQLSRLRERVGASQVVRQHLFANLIALARCRDRHCGRGLALFIFLISKQNVLVLHELSAEVDRIWFYQLTFRTGPL
jgi:hypothetical protein